MEYRQWNCWPKGRQWQMPRSDTGHNSLLHVHDPMGGKGCAEERSPHFPGPKGQSKLQGKNISVRNCRWGCALNVIWRPGQAASCFSSSWLWPHPQKMNLASCLLSSFSFSIPTITNLVLQVQQENTERQEGRHYGALKPHSENLPPATTWHKITLPSCNPHHRLT